jgi:short-subunit dehydrogenase
MKDLKAANVIVTGASRGLGVRIAKHFAEAGANLALVARNAEALNALASELSRHGTKNVALAADLGDATGHESLIARAEAALGPIDVLVNNAAVESNSAFVDFAPERIEEMVRLDLLSPMLLTRALLPRLVARKRGHIVNISSLAGKSATPYNTTYSAAKAGLVLFSQSLRGELRDSGVGVSVICPGFISDVGMFADKAEQHQVRAPSAAGESSPDKVAAAVLRAIRDDRAEILVTPGPMRLLQAFNQLAPELFSSLTARLGVTEVFRRVALAERGSAGESGQA